MNIKNTSLSLFLLLSISLFSQKVAENKWNSKVETNQSYLDSIKKSFVKYKMASSVDSLWMKELTNMDIYNNISEDLKTINSDDKVDNELPTELLKKRLAAMDAKSPFNIEYSQGLENLIKSFLKNRKKSFGRLMGVSEYYFPLFEEALAKQNVPLEIKYLAVVESALNPKAVSRVGATGLWQFMYQTGKQYGLNIDSYVDERNDPLKSSEAAAKYMTNMYTIFGDWDLVLASYNSGPGNVSKAIRRSGGQQNFWNIRKNLPKETQDYVPAFLATMYIYEYHTAHGIRPERALLKHFATDTVMIKKQLSFKQISDLLDIPVAQLQVLNPSYKLDVIPFYQDQSHYLRLPQDKVAVFASNENIIYAYVQHELDRRERPFQAARAVAVRDTVNNYSAEKDTLSKTKYYRVRQGDNLTAIASKYDVSVSDLKIWNHLRSNLVSQGKNLKIITSESVVGSVNKGLKPDSFPINIAKDNQRLATTEVKNNKEEKDKKGIKTETLQSRTPISYVVQKGDNLGNIAKKFDVSVAEIQEWNHLSNANLQLGVSLQVAKQELDSVAEVAAAPELKNIEYVVQKGDNLVNIAKKFGVAFTDLKHWNNISNNTIALGSSLIVSKNEVIITTNKAGVDSFKKKDNLALANNKERTEYFVKKGDSLYSISKKYPGVTISDLKKWNDIHEEELKPGMKLKING